MGKTFNRSEENSNRNRKAEREEAQKAAWLEEAGKLADQNRLECQAREDAWVKQETEAYLRCLREEQSLDPEFWERVEKMFAPLDD